MTPRARRRDGIGFLGVGAAACAACCAGPVLAFLGGMTLAGLGATLLIGVAGFVLVVLDGKTSASPSTATRTAPVTNPSWGAMASRDEAVGESPQTDRSCGSTAAVENQVAIDSARLTPTPNSAPPPAGGLLEFRPSTDDYIGLLQKCLLSISRREFGSPAL